MLKARNLGYVDNTHLYQLSLILRIKVSLISAIILNYETIGGNTADNCLRLRLQTG